MKEIGITPGGGAIVELTAVEVKIIQDAMIAIADKNFSPPFYQRGLADGDISPLFSIIAEWTSLRFNINHVRTIMDELQRAIGEKKSET